MVYLAESLALAALELLVHIDHERALDDFVAIPVDFEENLVLAVDPADLPEDWGEPQGLPYTQRLGDQWVREKASVLLRVPSRIVSVERNYLLNPRHPGAARVRLGEPQPFHYDHRLIKHS